jgi:hypothetical protein
VALRRVLLLTAIAAYAIVAVTPATATATPVAPAYVRTVCGDMTGPKWQTLVGGYSGSKYVVTVTGPQVAPSCAEAKAWVTKLVKDRAPNHSPSLINPNVLTNGPKGYSCKATADAEGRAYEGACYKGNVLEPTSEADWAPVLPL